jgi:hypothetical protein
MQPRINQGIIAKKERKDSIHLCMLSRTMATKEKIHLNAPLSLGLACNVEMERKESRKNGKHTQ